MDDNFPTRAGSTDDMVYTTYLFVAIIKNPNGEKTDQIRHAQKFNNSSSIGRFTAGMLARRASL